MAKTTSSVNYLTARRPQNGNPIVKTKTDPITGVTTEAVGRDAQGRIVSIVYQVGQSDSASETVTFTYNESGNIIFKGVEYKDHYINLWEATINPMDPAALDAACAAKTAADLKAIETLGLSTTNLVTTNNDYDLVVMNDGSLIFTPTIS